MIGDAPARHPLVRKISFTGGTRRRTPSGARGSGKLIHRWSGGNLTIEAGGCRYRTGGAGSATAFSAPAVRACIAGSRLFVHKFTCLTDARSLELTRGLRIGHLFSNDTHIGPLINEQHRDGVLAYVELAKREGGRVLCGGEIPADPALAAGSYFQPTIVEGLTRIRRASVRKRSSAPVLVAMPFRDEAQLIREANDWLHGLAAGIWTRDSGRPALKRTSGSRDGVDQHLQGFPFRPVWGL